MSLSMQTVSFEGSELLARANSRPLTPSTAGIFSFVNAVGSGHLRSSGRVGPRPHPRCGSGPEPLHDNQNDELVDWPNTCVTDLQARYFLTAAEDIGVAATNDFIYGPLHEGLRRQLLDALRAPGGPPGLILAELPDHPLVHRFSGGIRLAVSAPLTSDGSWYFLAGYMFGKQRVG